ncbi:unnamed protein product [Euphydryas editha]|uniref:Uncharacterized protein n=1 Tax=Euphydryas editha TaxID=104508 RepID=A0AAU9TSI0_EUPED|nr:unnamed protein product [Euphydryas editha]
MHLKRALGECHGDGTVRYCRSTPAVCAATRPPCTSSARSVSVTVTVRYCRSTPAVCAATRPPCTSSARSVSVTVTVRYCRSTPAVCAATRPPCTSSARSVSVTVTVRYGTVGARRPSALPRDHHAPQARAR